MGSSPNYGLDAELMAKRHAKYDLDLEDRVRAWIEAVTGQTSRAQPVAEWLKDGQMLCSLANAIKPGMIKKVNTSKMPFKQMENITFFMNAARDLGVPESSMFGTPDLFEEKNMGSVVLCIYIFAGVVQVACPDFAGPHLGHAVQPDVKDKKRNSCHVTQSSGFVTSLEIKKSFTFARDVGGADARHAPIESKHEDEADVLHLVNADAPDAQTRPAADALSLDADLRAKRLAKFDVGLEREVCEWIEQVSGEKKDSQSTHEWLKSGRVLCALANAIKPGLVEKVNAGSLPFKQMENITSFMNAARACGVPESSMFGTPDLFEEKNMGSVISCIFAFGGAVQVSVPDFKGPTIGLAHKADAKDRKREGNLAVSQYEAMQRTMEVERPKDSGITRGARSCTS